LVFFFFFSFSFSFWFFFFAICFIETCPITHLFNPSAITRK
jgi:hypothetical protein